MTRISQKQKLRTDIKVNQTLNIVKDLQQLSSILPRCEALPLCRPLYLHAVLVRASAEEHLLIGIGGQQEPPGGKRSTFLFL